MEAKKIISGIQQCLLEEANSLVKNANSLTIDIVPIIELLSTCTGKRCFIGVGKSFLVASKISSSFCSLGYASFSVDPLRLLHGELGAISKGDIVVAVSNSGETDMLLNAIKAVKARNIKVVAIVGDGSSSLAQMSNYFIAVPTSEAGPFGLVPSTSTTVMMAIGDALLCGLAEMDGLTIDTFRLFHPGGHIGQIMKGL